MFLEIQKNYLKICNQLSIKKIYFLRCNSLMIFRSPVDNTSQVNNPSSSLGKTDGSSHLYRPPHNTSKTCSHTSHLSRPAAIWRIICTLNESFEECLVRRYGIIGIITELRVGINKTSGLTVVFRPYRYWYKLQLEVVVNIKTSCILWNVTIFFKELN